jgi:diaminohydroxyphosphoribosylaminopyrimidine deaminase/5-amino-6-(5-phosphoribosylamino)uracil reductase
LFRLFSFARAADGDLDKSDSRRRPFSSFFKHSNAFPTTPGGHQTKHEKHTEYTKEDSKQMLRALALASIAAGDVFPNPLVGCVIVNDDGEVVGEGYHPKAGEPHAEVFALRAAGENARGATAYVSLEPCNHFGRTPPCSRALVNAGVRRVVMGFVDPDPRVSGGGIRTLLDAGIEVVVGCEEEACREINREFIDRNTK